MEAPESGVFLVIRRRKMSGFFNTVLRFGVWRSGATTNAPLRSPSMELPCSGNSKTANSGLLNSRGTPTSLQWHSSVRTADGSRPVVPTKRSSSGKLQMIASPWLCRWN